MHARARALQEARTGGDRAEREAVTAAFQTRLAARAPEWAPGRRGAARRGRAEQSGSVVARAPPNSNGARTPPTHPHVRPRKPTVHPPAPHSRENGAGCNGLRLAAGRALVAGAEGRTWNRPISPRDAPKPQSSD
eukprot:scaffold1744_cov340-Prasinococcus_capsulatus_cf.AAC.26